MLPPTGQLVLSASREAQVLLWIGVLVLVVVFGGLSAMYIRRRLLDKDQGTAGSGFLDELRAMQRRGEISPEEYEATRKAMSAKIRGSVGTPESVKQLRARAARARGDHSTTATGADGIIFAAGLSRLSDDGKPSNSKRGHDETREDARDEQHGSHRDTDRSHLNDNNDGGGADSADGGGGGGGGGGD
jgi:hypothetical protein